MGTRFSFTSNTRALGWDTAVAARGAQNLLELWQDLDHVSADGSSRLLTAAVRSLRVLHHVALTVHDRGRTSHL